MAATAEAPSNAPRVLDVVLMVAAPLAFPTVWVAGVVLLAVCQPRGWQTTLALCPLGLFLPLYLFTHGGAGGSILPVASLTSCLCGAWRLMSRRPDRPGKGVTDL